MLQKFIPNKEDEVLQLDVRRKIYEFVRKFSGCNFRELGRKSGIATGTLQYHLNYLVRHEVIEIEKDGNKIRYFTKEITSINKKLLSFLRQRNVRAILLIIIEKGEVQQKDIIGLLGISASATYLHLMKLVKNNVVKSVKRKGRVYYKISIDENEVIRLLISYRDSFFDNMVEKAIEMWEF
jgi:predicted transcriptional regulator